MLFRVCLSAALIILVGCASSPQQEQAQDEARDKDKAKTICDSYIVFEMCVGDLVHDGTVDMVYFSDTNEVFMYRSGMREQVAAVMPMHQCAVALSPGMQATTNRILGRSDMSMKEEVGIARELIANYLAAKPDIDACNDRHAAKARQSRPPEEEFFTGDWDDEEL